MSTHVDKNTKPLHAPHYTGAVNTDNLVVLAPSAKNPIFRYPNPDHAVTSGYKRDVWTEHTTNCTVATNVFHTNGAFTTLDIPEDSHEIQRHDSLQMDLKEQRRHRFLDELPALLPHGQDRSQSG